MIDLEFKVGELGEFSRFPAIIRSSFGDHSVITR